MPKIILVIEDDADIRRVLIRLLQKASYTVMAVENGRIALETLKHVYFDLILLDLQMPELDGNQFLKACHDYVPAAPVIIVSANPNFLDSTYSQVKATVPKPFFIKEILEVISKVLDEVEEAPEPPIRPND